MATKAFQRKARFILVSDLDWTMVDHSDKTNASLLAFNDLWKEHFAKDSLLIFSTGRSHALYTKLQKEVPLAEPDILVCSVGTEIFYEAGDKPIPDQKWIQCLDQGWNRELILKIASSFTELTLQDASEQRPHKVSFRVSSDVNMTEGKIDSLRQRLQHNDVQAKIIYSGGEDLDILPLQASKGKGLEFLLAEIKDAVGEPELGVLVNGDSGNDIELFQVEGVRGTMVANAHSELRQWVQAHPSPNIFEASSRCAGGIIEALQHFKLVSGYSR